MSITQIAGVIVGMVFSFFSILIAYIFVGWGWSDGGGHWSAVQWVFTLIPWSVPFWFSFWIVYRCFYTDNDTEDVQILFWHVCPRALWRAFLAELCVVLLIFACCFVLDRIGRSSKRQSGTLPHTTVAPPSVIQN